MLTITVKPMIGSTIRSLAVEVHQLANMLPVFVSIKGGFNGAELPEICGGMNIDTIERLYELAIKTGNVSDCYTEMAKL